MTDRKALNFKDFLLNYSILWGSTFKQILPGELSYKIRREPRLFFAFSTFPCIDSPRNAEVWADPERDSKMF